MRLWGEESGTWWGGSARQKRRMQVPRYQDGRVRSEPSVADQSSRSFVDGFVCFHGRLFGSLHHRVQFKVHLACSHHEQEGYAREIVMKPTLLLTVTAVAQRHSQPVLETPVLQPPDQTLGCPSTSWSFVSATVRP